MLKGKIAVAITALVLTSRAPARQRTIDDFFRDLYVVFPGQACSYMMGQLKIVELREKARKALADKFSLRDFHNVVLGTGTVPLEILERQVDGCI